FAHLYKNADISIYISIQHKHWCWNAVHVVMYIHSIVSPIGGSAFDVAGTRGSASGRVNHSSSTLPRLSLISVLYCLYGPSASVDSFALAIDKTMKVLR